MGDGKDFLCFRIQIQYLLAVVQNQNTALHISENRMVRYGNHIKKPVLQNAQTYKEGTQGKKERGRSVRLHEIDARQIENVRNHGKKSCCQKKRNLGLVMPGEPYHGLNEKNAAG